MKKIFFIILFLFSTLFANRVILETSEGNITLSLFPEVAPKAVENFQTHIKNGYYDGLIFHRVIKGFMMQGGDPTGTSRNGNSIWNKDFEDEFMEGVEFDKAGVLAMANAGPNTNGSQFFITFDKTPWLNGYHTIFGEVVDGFDVLKKIETSPTNKYDRPIEDIKIIKAIFQELVN
ncbi:cyclophilin domain-containing protein [Campylobacter blaseri]|uniref:Peptidyl-prolyl cis-trans isomerase n=1 Tax=Campylobacter blaseri TaxID=2042961 RepID=A0A2P8R1B5_9BACT|nr:peptidylprolyl isomerase [Campylobacter blaseri]PSM52293.1 peptidylprolyl isomerase [Campylobacter blaseri]PSM54059.1 peptidylprolyl isomerase [Campylobacter blaseri]QKF85500.1 cyclophilin domain-containing protein [Campylobacter blaseri]